MPPEDLEQGRPSGAALQLPAEQPGLSNTPRSFSPVEGLQPDASLEQPHSARQGSTPRHPHQQATARHLKQHPDEQQSHTPTSQKAGLIGQPPFQQSAVQQAGMPYHDMQVRLPVMHQPGVQQSSTPQHSTPLHLAALQQAGVQQSSTPWHTTQSHLAAQQQSDVQQSSKQTGVYQKKSMQFLDRQDGTGENHPTLQQLSAALELGYWPCNSPRPPDSWQTAAQQATQPSAAMQMPRVSQP